MGFFRRLAARLSAPSPDAKTLGDLVTLAADEPTPAHRDAVLGRLLFAKVGARCPASPPDDPALGSATAFGFPNVSGPDGDTYLLAVCDIPAVVAAFPDERFFEIEARVALEMARDNGVGLIVQNRLDKSLPWVVVPKEDVPAILAGECTEQVQVPPGMKVVVIQPQPHPHFTRCESGVWAADLGSGYDIAEIIAMVHRKVHEDPEAAIVWILQPTVLLSNRLDAAVAAIDAVTLARGRTAGQIVVAPYASEPHRDALRRLKACGVSVHLGGLNGECFLEVHRPDGIAIGMPGPQFTG